MKIELILPDNLDKNYWKQIQKVKLDYFPIKGSIINPFNKNGYSRPFVVSGTRTVLKKGVFGKKIRNQVYLEECEFPREFYRKEIFD